MREVVRVWRRHHIPVPLTMWISVRSVHPIKKPPLMVMHIVEDSHIVSRALEDDATEGILLPPVLGVR